MYYLINQVVFFLYKKKSILTLCIINCLNTFFFIFRPPFVFSKYFTDFFVLLFFLSVFVALGVNRFLFIYKWLNGTHPAHSFTLIHSVGYSFTKIKRGEKNVCVNKHDACANWETGKKKKKEKWHTQRKLCHAPSFLLMPKRTSVLY